MRTCLAVLLMLLAFILSFGCKSNGGPISGPFPIIMFTATETVTSTVTATETPTVTFTVTPTPTVYAVIWGKCGCNGTLWEYSAGLALSNSGNIYVCGFNSDLVVKFNSAGQCVTMWGESGTGNGQFAWGFGPFGIAVDSSDNVYVSDRANGRIQKFDSDGGYLDQITQSSLGTAIGVIPAVVGTNGLAKDSLDNLYAIAHDYSLGNAFVVKFGPSMSAVTLLFEVVPLHGIDYQDDTLAVDNNANIYVGSPVTDQIYKYDSSGAPVTQWAIDAGLSSTGPFMAFDSSNNFYIANRNNYKMQIRNPITGIVLNEFDLYSNGIAVDASGYLYGSHTNCVFKLSL